MFNFKEFNTQQIRSIVNTQCMHITHMYTHILHLNLCNVFCLIARLLNSPIAFHWLRSIGAIEVRHLLVIVKREYSSDDKVTFGHKARLKVVLNYAHACCQKERNEDVEGAEKRKAHGWEWSHLSPHPQTQENDRQVKATVLLLLPIDDVICSK